MPQHEPEIIAAVDLGSNSFHMIVCRIDNGQIIILDRLREMVRLAAGINKKKILSDEAQQRALDCLTRFGQRLRELPDYCVRIVGTNTLRSAHNARDFIHKAELCLGHSIEIISGVEEARLIYLGVAYSLAAEDERRLVMDIGGGSTELIIGEKFEPLYMESLYMGCVSMSKRFFKSGKITAEKIKHAQIAALQELEPYVSRLTKMQWQYALGASGTIRAIDKIVHGQGWAENGITLESLEKLLEVMLSAGHIDKLNLEQLDPERLPVFAGGVMILYTTFKTLGIKNMRVSDGALREGLVHDLLGRIHHEDIRAKSVSALATRYHADLDQVHRVQQTANYCLNELAPNWNIDLDEHAQWLQWAIMLYEIGFDIAHSQYQKHGAYIIENADLAGFSKQEQQLLSIMVLAHRKKVPLDAFDSLPSHWYELAIKLTILLRLATLLHRSRTDLSDTFKISAKKKTISIEFSTGWLEAHSLTHADLIQEQDFLNKIGFELIIE